MRRFVVRSSPMRVKTASGERVSSLARDLMRGEEITLFGELGSEMERLRQGDVVFAEPDNGGNGYRFVRVETREECLERLVKEEVKLLAKCFRGLQEQLPELPPELLQPLACTVYIRLTRR